ncbi:glutathione S-transferase family protein [Paraburkholderia caribensis]|uniref:glutathione S-transferase family protein n=1 Tax=Paraburkholderia caribensis TaxID=75105 RepID=UPI00078BD6C7|nr:glutathione S-transferase family protein [Paraburkholderia caribensis]AMV48279.1 hypothetical protein ATN79_47305 [Paraburkholderia caribensis]
MPEFTLCCFPETSARATMFALEQAKASYDTRLYDIMRGDQFSLPFLQINPRGQIPVLAVDGKVLTDSVAILGYLCDRFPDAGLAPDDPFQKAEALSVVAWLSSSALPALLRIVRPYRIHGDPAVADGIARMARIQIRENLAIANRHLTDRIWWQQAWSVADSYLHYMVVDAIRFGVDMKGFDNLARHAEESMKRPAVLRVIEWEKQTLRAMSQ